MEVVRIRLKSTAAAVVAASSVARWVLIAWAQGTKVPVVRVHNIVTCPLIVVSTAGVQILTSMVRPNGVVLIATTCLLIGLWSPTSEYLPS